MISFLQKFKKSVAASTGKQNFEQTLPAEERSAAGPNWCPMKWRN